VADVIATFPGKIGDLFMQWPVARAYALDNNIKVDIGIPPFMAGVAFLMDMQPEVEGVYFTPESVMRSWKRDPPPKGISTEPWRRWDTQLEMGFRDMPDDQITLYIADCLGLSKDGDYAPSLFVGDKVQENYCVLHGTFLTQDGSGSSPPFWAALGNWLQFMMKEFDKIYFIGGIDEMREVRSAEFPFEVFDDGGNLLETAQLINNSRLFIGSSSMGAALAGALGVNAIRVHEDIPPLPKKCWDFLLPNQFNYKMQPGDGVDVLQKYMERWC